MRFWFDTEFVEDGHTIDLVSIGIVAEDGCEFYGVSSEFDTGKLLANDWLRANVWPHLPLKHCPPGRRCSRCGGNGTGVGHLDDEHPAVRPRGQLARAVHAFLVPPDSPDDYRAELWADYSAYDHVALAQLFGPMNDLPPGLPMFTRDIQQYAADLGVAELPQQAEGLHDALADARHCRTRWEFLENLRG